MYCGSNRTTFKNGFQSDRQAINKRQLLRIIYNGNVKLLARHNKDKRKQQDPFTGEQKVEYIDKVTYYIVTSNGQFHKVDFKQESILDALSKHRGELKSYASNQKLDFGDENDLKKIIKKYEKIISDSI